MSLGTIHAEPATGLETKDVEVGSLFVSNYPPFSFWTRDAVGKALAALDAPPRPGTPLGLYLHIPFCRKRCKFCYFRVYTGKNHDEIGSYLDALATEVELYSRMPAVAGRPLEFVYVGGGTPSFLSVAQLTGLVARLGAAIPWGGAREVTFECEPGTLSEAKVAAIRSIGVTRLSLGIENFDDDILRSNGRAHVSKEIYRCMPWIEAQGFAQLNIDLIAGMVGESWGAWRETVKKTVDLAPDSVTIYQMELPYNTRFAHGVLDGSLAEPLADWDTKRAWLQFAFEELAKAGYEQSSAYTMVKAGSASSFVYRDANWHGCDMLGTGVASFGHVNGVLFQNVDGWGEYLARLQRGELALSRAFAPNERERMTREAILQMKLGRLSGRYFRDKFGMDLFRELGPAFERLAERGMVELDADSLTVTPAGLLRVDSLLPELYDATYRNSRYT